VQPTNSQQGHCHNVNSAAVEVAASWSALLLVQVHVMDGLSFMARMSLIVLFCVEMNQEAVNGASQMHAVWVVSYA